MTTIKPNKKSYTDLSTVLILLSTFAGAVTLQTQFSLPETCDGSRVRTLMAFASQFFLMCPISVFSIFVALHNRPDTAVIETGKHQFLQVQFAITGVMIVTGFLLLNVAVQYAGGQLLGSAGLALTATFILVTVFCSVEDHLRTPEVVPVADAVSRGEEEEQKQGRDDGDRISPLQQQQAEDEQGIIPSQDESGQLSLSQFLGLRKSRLLIPRGRLILRWIVVGLVVLEVVGILLLLGLGIAQTRLASPGTCQVL
ncbi:uncharacterized protein BJX67DRAFT_384897 [Aspergillus lucknowensis]|uniref:Uncharacterized protein n=1 Tax=Aspergillus lucknowensis TaxID=176173 RepID=A0ABR4LFY7_9EURO